MSKHASELSVFEAALSGGMGEVICAIADIPEEALIRVVEAAQLVDREGRWYGDAYYDWNGSQAALEDDDVISLPGQST